MSKKRYGVSMTGVMILLLTIFLPASGLAKNVSETEDVIDSEIKIYVDGVLFVPAVNPPEAVKLLRYDGTAYLPIWALSEALGTPVEWDSATSSVYIGEPAEIAEITVSTAEELVAALGSNRRILLEEGVYNLSTVDSGYIDSNVYFGERPDGTELFLSGVHNLTIEGIGDEQSEIIVEPRYANVINFLNCSNISIENIKAGHTEGGVCSGGVFLFENCANIQIANTDMYGCGTLGLFFDRVKDAKVSNSTIYECTSGIAIVQRSSNILLEDCVFRDNLNSFMISVEHTSGLTFNSCSFLRNNGSSVFYLVGSESITVENTEFIDNNAATLFGNEAFAVDASNRFENNSFEVIR